jgi:hypothetical protein
MKMLTPHIVLLAKQALEVLGTLRDLTGRSEWFFPADRTRASKRRERLLQSRDVFGTKGQDDAELGRLPRAETKRCHCSTNQRPTCLRLELPCQGTHNLSRALWRRRWRPLKTACARQESQMKRIAYLGDNLPNIPLASLA